MLFFARRNFFVIYFMKKINFATEFSTKNETKNLIFNRAKKKIAFLNFSIFFRIFYLLDRLNFLSCPSPIESRLSLRLRWQALRGEGFCECSTSLETGVESVEKSKMSMLIFEEVFSVFSVVWWTLR